MRAEDMIVFVFSFNRGPFLANCVNSLRTAAIASPVVIFDDNSDDSDTLEVLQQLGADYEIVKADNSLAHEFRTGGLSGMMMQALLIAQQRGYRYALFIQDDMQFVRRLTPGDYDRVAHYFAAVGNSFQLSTNFIRSLSCDDVETNCVFDADAGAYIRKPEQERGKSSFSDTGILHVERYFALFHPFEVGEPSNSRKARERGLVLGKSPYPFMCWLPYPTSYRGKKKSFAHAMFETLGRSGFYPIRFMSDPEAKAFLQRPPHDLPVMERFLVAPDNPRADRWSTGGGEYNLLAYGGLAARAFRLVRDTKRWLSGRAAG